MATPDHIVTLLREHRTETKQEFDRLTAALVDLSRATSELATITTRMEERHSRHDDAMTVVRNAVLDHETRIRLLEAQVLKSLSAAFGGWKAATVIGSAVVTLFYVVHSFYKG